MPAASLPLSSQVEAILAYKDDILTTADAAAITKRSCTTISQACTTGEIEANFSCSRGRGTRKRWRFSRAALLAYIWKNTTGSRNIIREALRQKSPELLAILEPAPEPAAPLPENVIDISTRRSRNRAADPLAGHTGDLFARANAG